MFGLLTQEVARQEHPPFDHVVIDEAQDVSVAQLRFLAVVAGNRPNGLLLAGDLGQRIFQQPFSWKELGVDIRGRSQTLRINYRTSHQIRTYADRLLDPELSDVDGNLEERKGTVSAFNGPTPTVQVLGDEDAECAAVSKWLGARISEGLQPGEISVFVRSLDQIGRAVQAVEGSNVQYAVLDDEMEATDDRLAIGTMHLAKGMEYRAVVVMACDSEVIPLQSRVESIADEADLEEVYNTERNLLYVACTRARDHLLVTGVEPASEFLDDLQL
jgi:superfamily I DNA/RNA helicase